MALDPKKYLDLVGLKHYDEKIKALISANAGDASAAAAKALVDAKAYTDEKIGTLEEDAADVAAAVAKVATAVVGEKTRAEGVEEGLAERIEALENDTADADALDDEIERATAAEDALADRLDIIEGEGEGSIKKAAADATADAIAQLISDSEEAPISERFDTLKEIADWILSDESAAEGLDAATRLTALEDAVGDEESGLVKGLADEISRAEEAESDLQDAIDAVEEKVDAFVAITNDEIDELFEDEIAGPAEDATF